MIQANEVRIGNKVLYDTSEGKELCTIDGTDICSLEQREGYRNDHYPIPLTPEILLACGFVGGHKEVSQFEVINISSYDAISENFEVSLSSTEASTNAYGYHTAVSSLHELQNLFFALTGTELEYKPLTTYGGKK